MKKIIDHKAVDITADEAQLYEKICHSYDEPPSTRGRDLFHDLFEVDEEGLITFLKPPKRQTTMEICLFLQNIMVHQRLRNADEKMTKALTELNKRCEGRILELDKKIKELDEKIGEMNAKKEELLSLLSSFTSLTEKKE